MLDPSALQTEKQTSAGGDPCAQDQAGMTATWMIRCLLAFLLAPVLLVLVGLTVLGAGAVLIARVGDAITRMFPRPVESAVRQAGLASRR
mgnify:CR=1 FL=1